MEVSEAPTTPQIAFKKRGAKSNLRKRPATPPPADDSESGFTSSEDEQGRQIKRRRKTAGVTASSKNENGAKPAEPQREITNATIPSLKDADVATKTSNWYDEGNEKAATKLASRPIEIDGTYKGAANYQSFVQKNPDREAKQVGPVKSSTNVRTITVTDFAPDVCKDYKQTGYCGFGDSCKFLHAREDYKQGWELDRDWEVGTKGKKIVGKTVASANRTSGTADDDDDDALLESIPFACIICKKPYTNPIVTKCAHYFCEACALKRYRKDPSCAACSAGTGGVFNTAKKLNRLLEKKRERARLRREKTLENGEEISDDEEGAQSP
jgi:RING finger protein 113A